MQTSMIFPLLLQLLKISTTHAQALTAYVKVTNWTCTNSISPNCSNYQLKIGYAKVKACTLSTNSITAFAQNDNQQTFPLSSRNVTKFTYVPEKTSNEHLMVLVFDETNQFQTTSCENLKQRHEHGNTTSIHTDAYFTTDSAKYSFDIEIITLCPTTVCSGLFCNHCVTTDERTTLPLISSTLTTTLTNTTKDTTVVTSEFTTTTLVTTTNLKLGEQSNITTTSIALIAVIIALVLVIMIVFYKWWNNKNKVNDDSNDKENESTDTIVPYCSNHSNKEKQNECNSADFFVVDRDEISPIEDSPNNILPENDCGNVVPDESSGHKKQKKKKKKKASKDECSTRHNDLEDSLKCLPKIDTSKTRQNSEGITETKLKKEEKTKGKRKKEKHGNPDQNGYASTRKGSSGHCTNTPPIDHDSALSDENPVQNPSTLSDKGFPGKLSNTCYDRNDNCSDDNENHTTDQRRCKTARYERDHSNLKRIIGNSTSENIRPSTARNSNTSNVGPSNHKVQFNSFFPAKCA